MRPRNHFIRNSKEFVRQYKPFLLHRNDFINNGRLNVVHTPSNCLKMSYRKPLSFLPASYEWYHY